VDIRDGDDERLWPKVLHIYRALRSLANWQTCRPSTSSYGLPANRQMLGRVLEPSGRRWKAPI